MHRLTYSIPETCSRDVKGFELRDTKCHDGIVESSHYSREKERDKIVKYIKSERVLYAIHSFRPAMRGDNYKPLYIHNRTLIDRKRENSEKTKDPLDHLYFNFFLSALCDFRKKN